MLLNDVYQIHRLPNAVWEELVALIILQTIRIVSRYPRNPLSKTPLGFRLKGFLRSAERLGVGAVARVRGVGATFAQHMPKRLLAVHIGSSLEETYGKDGSYFRGCSSPLLSVSSLVMQSPRLKNSFRLNLCAPTVPYNCRKGIHPYPYSEDSRRDSCQGKHELIRLTP